MIRGGEKAVAIVVARIGDTLLATPALRALREACGANGHLTVYAHPRRVALLRELPFIDRLAAITKTSARWFGRFTAPRFDVAAVWGHDEPLVRYALRLARRVVALEQADNALNRRLFAAVKPADGLLHAVADRMRIVRALGADAANLRLAYVVSRSEAEAAQATLAQLFPRPPATLVGIQPNSYPTKRYRDWPCEHFGALLERLFDREPAARVLIFGDSDSVETGRRLAERFPGKVVSVAGRMSLRESAALMARLDLYVGVDTGPTHLAGALDVPIVALYHCRHRGTWLAPLQHPALTVIEHPAGDAECHEGRTMAEIPVERVWNAVLERLDARRSAMQAR